MALISQDEINNIRASVNIVDIIGGFIPLNKKGKNYFCVCPFHDDHTPSMSVSEEKQIYKCFSCGASGNVFTFLQNYENMGFIDAVSEIAKTSGVAFNKQITVKKRGTFDKHYEIMELANKFYQNNLKTPLATNAKKYLKDREINEDIIKEFEIGLALSDKDALNKLLSSKNFSEKLLIDTGIANTSEWGLSDTFTNRIMFPIHDEKGTIVAFTGRTYISDERAKYVNSKESVIFKKGHILYNYHNAAKAAKLEKKIIVVEGNMDAIRLSSCGIKNVVALMGTSLTKEQIALLKKLRVDILLCLDNDDAGLKSMDTCGELLRKNGCETFVIKLTDANDPDDYIGKFGIDTFQNLIKNPVKYFDYHLSYLKENKNLDNPDDLAKYINACVTYLGDIDDDILKEITINKLSEDYKISPEVLKNKLKKNESPPKEDLKPQIKKEHKPKTGIDKATETILYYMLNDAKYIRLYERSLGYFEDSLYRNIANEINYYYKLNNDITIADFISYIHDKELINTKVLEIINHSEKELSEENFNKNIEVIKKQLILSEIKDIKNEIKNELDENKKIELLNRLTEIKKEV